MVFVALAGIVRKRWSVVSGPIWNLYSVPGVRPVSSQRWTLNSVSGNGLVIVLRVVQSPPATGATRISAAESVPTHWTVIVVVGSCCQVRNREASGSLLTDGGAALAALSFGAVFSWAKSDEGSEAAARPPIEEARNVRRESESMAVTNRGKERRRGVSRRAANDNTSAFGTRCLATCFLF